MGKIKINYEELGNGIVRTNGCVGLLLVVFQVSLSMKLNAF